MTRDEAGRVEAHVADCPRCQAMLAMFVQTAPEAPPPAAPWWRFRLGWLVPLATAVLVVAVWVAVPDLPPPVPPQVAGDRGSEGSAGSVPAPSRAPLAGAGSAPAPPREETTQMAQAVRAPQAGRRAEAKLGSEVGAGSEVESGSEAAALPRLVAPPESRASVSETAARNAAAAADRAERVAAGVPPPPAPPPPASSSASFPAAPAPMPLAESVAVIRDILSPDPQRLWRIVGDRVVQRSTDGGATWRPAAFDAGVPLAAGHAPAPSIVWVVGNAGTIYLSADGMAFERVPFVQPVDLRAVTAIDAHAARVTTADGTVWQTADRGATWVQVR